MSASNPTPAPCSPPQPAPKQATSTTRRCKRALHESRGPWAPGIELGALGERVRADIGRAQASVLREAARRHAAGGGTPRRRDVLNELLQLQPTEEWAYQELMRLDLAAGHPHAALKTHDIATRMLAERLGLRPAPATAALAAMAAMAAARLQDGDTTAAPGSDDATCGQRAAAAFASPSPPVACRLIGREPPVELIEQALAEEAAIVALSGPIGIGKTALLAEAARRCTASLRSRACWITADDPAPAETALQRFQRVAQAALPGDASPHPPTPQTLAGALAEHHGILVFDDIDRLPEAAALIDAIRACSPRPRVLLSVQRRPLKLRRDLNNSASSSSYIAARSRSQVHRHQTSRRGNCGSSRGCCILARRHVRTRFAQ